MRNPVCGWRSHCAWMMGRVKTAMPGGFLMMIFLVSGISALKCHSSSSAQHNGSWVEIPTDVSLSQNITTCSKGQNACVEAQVTLSVGQMALSVTHRGCAEKELNEGAEFNSSGDPHLTVKPNVRYCFTDLCNKELSSDVPWSPGEETAPEESDSHQCFLGLTLSPEESVRGVTCRRGYSQCYQGHGSIEAGPLATSVLIKSCQKPDCLVPKNLTFGPIKIHQWGSCCLGSYCNVAETARKIPVSPATNFTKLDAENAKKVESSAAGRGAGLPGHQFHLITTTQDPSYESATDYYYDDWLENLGPPENVGVACRFPSGPFCHLLVALGIAVWEAW